MAGHKEEPLSIRTSVDVKALLKKAADQERRSAPLMMNVLILGIPQQHSLKAFPGKKVD